MLRETMTSVRMFSQQPAIPFNINTILENIMTKLGTPQFIYFFDSRPNIVYIFY
jgi:hypothetical protein